MASFMRDENSAILGLNTPLTPNASGLKEGTGLVLFTPSPAPGGDQCPAPLYSCSITATPCVNADKCPNSVSSLNASDCSDVAFRIPSTPDDIEISEPRAIIDLTDTPNAESDPEAEYESIASPETSISTSSGPSSEEVRRQLEESERLAWELMQQDSLEAFNMQLEFIRQNSAGMDEADLQALTRAMEEERMAHEMMVRRAEAAARRAPLTVRDGAAAADDDEEEVGEGGSVEPDEQEEEDDSANWTYDQLLALGEAVGDVKTERWRLRSTNEIARLPKLVYDSSELSSRALNYGVDKRCAVCMEEFESSSEVCLLPCRHFFHSECSAQWLKDHNACPSCKIKITSSP